MNKYTTRTYQIDRALIAPGNNDRTIFNATELQALADNIAANGLLQPIMIRPVADGRYEIILGERRFRAMSLLAWEKIPCIIRDVSDEEASAGDAWAALGKSFKRQECQAAARALETVLMLV